MGVPRSEYFDWTEKRVEALKKHWANGLSCSQISAKFGGEPSRNAIIGKVRRLGLPDRQFTQSVNMRRRHREAERFAKRFTFGASSSSPRRDRPPEGPPHSTPPAVAHPETMERVPFLKLKARQCKFPLWDDEDEHRDCCGNRTPSFAEPYCEHHERITTIVSRKGWSKDDPRRFKLRQQVRQTFRPALEDA